MNWKKEKEGIDTTTISITEPTIYQTLQNVKQFFFNKTDGKVIFNALYIILYVFWFSVYKNRHG